LGEIFAHQAMFPDHEHDHIDPFLAYKAVSDPDTLYYHQAMKEPDKGIRIRDGEKNRRSIRERRFHRNPKI
jgi:hypothetical protein